MIELSDFECTLFFVFEFGIIKASIIPAKVINVAIKNVSHMLIIKDFFMQREPVKR